MPLESFVHSQSGKPQDRKWISRQVFTQAFRQLLRYHFRTGDGDKTGDVVTLDGNIGCSDMVPKLILTRIALKESIEVDIPATKS